MQNNIYFDRTSLYFFLCDTGTNNYKYLDLGVRQGIQAPMLHSHLVVLNDITRLHLNQVERKICGDMKDRREKSFVIVYTDTGIRYDNSC
jgi:hypothetical protein